MYMDILGCAFINLGVYDCEFGYCIWVYTLKGCVWMNMGGYWSICVFRCVWVYFGVQECIWVNFDVYGCVLVYMSVSGCIWMYMGVHECI